MLANNTNMNAVLILIIYPLLPFKQQNYKKVYTIQLQSYFLQLKQVPFITKLHFQYKSLQANPFSIYGILILTIQLNFRIIAGLSIKASNC